MSATMNSSPPLASSRLASISCSFVGARIAAVGSAGWSGMTRAPAANRFG